MAFLWMICIFTNINSKSALSANSTTWLLCTLEGQILNQIVLIIINFTLFALQVSMRDLRLTFLPAFQKCVQAGAYSLMCSYNRSVLSYYMLLMPYTCGDGVPAFSLKKPNPFNIGFLNLRGVKNA